MMHPASYCQERRIPEERSCTFRVRRKSTASRDGPSRGWCSRGESESKRRQNRDRAGLRNLCECNLWRKSSLGCVYQTNPCHGAARWMKVLFYPLVAPMRIVLAQGWLGGVPKYASRIGFPVGAAKGFPAGSKVTKTVSISSSSLGSSNFIAQRCCVWSSL